MEIEDLKAMFDERPFKMTGTHRAVLNHLIHVYQCAVDWAVDTSDDDAADILLDSIQEMNDL